IPIISGTPIRLGGGNYSAGGGLVYCLSFANVPSGYNLPGFTITWRPGPNTFTQNTPTIPYNPPPPPPPPLTISYATSPTTSTPGQTVSFTASATGGIPPYTFTWTFGDGGSASGPSVTHTYTTAGSYPWSLTVNDSATPHHTAYTATYYLVQQTSPLTASFTYSPTSPTAGQTVTFTGTAKGGFSRFSQRRRLRLLLSQHDITGRTGHKHAYRHSRRLGLWRIRQCQKPPGYERSNSPLLNPRNTTIELHPDADIHVQYWNSASSTTSTVGELHKLTHYSNGWAE